MTPEPILVTLRITQTLESLNIPYLIGGSFASTAYGRIRTTQDVDIVTDLTAEQVPPFLTAVQQDFYADEQMMLSAIERRSHFNLIHLETMFKVDIFVPKKRPFDQEQLARRVKRPLDKEGANTAYFASAEDTILAKFEWYRLGGEQSERQWLDILSILTLQKTNLDHAYLQKWAEALQVEDLLNRALAALS
ncbi:MAG: hypothetical protein IT327_20795 [Anaerolineae bacterium]|nr:hypothetical protein [Anaerolineae bacterium]